MSLHNNQKRYHSLSEEFKHHFSCKVIKLSLDGGFTCPNRDGTISRKGCIFCSEKGSGDFAGVISSKGKEPSFNWSEFDPQPPSLRLVPPLHLQMDFQRSLLAPKWPQAKYVAYFQNFSNTYAPISILKQKYEEALAYQDVVGLAIATRPDCLTRETLQLLSSLNQQTFLWVEFGLQTIHDASAKWMNRGYDLSAFDDAVESLHRCGIRVVVHTIAGFPWEEKGGFTKTALYIAQKGVWGIKIHMLHVLENTALGKLYRTAPFPLICKEEYIRLVATTLAQLPPRMVIHRLTGDAPGKELLAPRWTLDKRSVLNGLARYLKTEDLWQGKYWAETLR